MITPTVGRIVLYRNRQVTEAMIELRPDDPMPAMIVFCHSDRLVNLSVFLPNGTVIGAHCVPLLQADDPHVFDKAAPYCTWMPYQLGQAARTEAAEAALAGTPQLTPAHRAG